jgi:flagellar biosynthesis/type III secretory pathway chaperone
MKVDEKQIRLFETDKEKVIRQFQSLEQKIGSLIELTEALKQEKMNLIERLRVQEENLDTLSEEAASLKAEIEQEESRILTLRKRADQQVPNIDGMAD